MSKARGFAEGAKLYMECALAADNKIGMMPGFESHAPYPVMSNVAHAIELSLKSFLLQNGFEDIKSLGHDLNKSLEKCKEISPEANAHLEAIDEGLLAIISDLHQGMTLRYGEASKLGRLPIFGPMQEIGNHCLELCGAPSRYDLWGQY